MADKGGSVASSAAPKMAEAVKVVVRCRPMNERENKLGCQTVVKMEDNRGLCVISKPDVKNQPPKEFTFDGVYFTNSVTEQIYNDLAYPLVEGVVEGYNGTVFAYGQTGCGKSFSMQGVEKPPAQRGIIPRAFQHIFESVSVAENTKYLVHASYLEIYNEDVRDLLSKNIKERLELKEHPDKGVYVKDLLKLGVSSVKDCEKVMATGWNNRAVGATLMNADSSRSHSIFTIYLEACSAGADGKEHIRAGKLNLVDLAGSERQSKTGSTGDRLKEATKINLSLSALGNVISALVDGKSKHIPYRDSKLTRLLQDSLGGNTKTLMLACISPADNNYDETLSTLRYANRAKNIKNKPKINEDPKDALLREYQEEIKKLRDMLASQSQGGSAPAAIDLPSETDADEYHASPPPLPEEMKAQEEKVRREKKEREKVEKSRADKLKKEFQQKIDELKKQYEAEQMSNVKLQQDMKKLQSHYEEKLQQSSVGASVDATSLSFHSFNAGYFTNTSSPCSSDEDDVTDIATTSSSVSDVSEASDSDVSSDDDVAMYQQSASFMLKFSEFIYKHALRVSVQRSIHGNPGVKRAALNIALASSNGSSVSDAGFYDSFREEKEAKKQSDKEQESDKTAADKSSKKTKGLDKIATETEKPAQKTKGLDKIVTETEKPAQKGKESGMSSAKVTAVPTNDAGKGNKDDVMKQHEEALKRLQMLEHNMVGGEKSKDEEAKKKIVSRKQHADERKRRLAEAAKRDDEETMLGIYDSMTKDVKQSAQVIERQKNKIQALKMEIEDINYEFERDRSEYLSSIRKQEQEIDLLKAIISKIHPAIRRDCNYTNLDKIRSAAKYDEDNESWIVPDLQITKTTLPSAVSPASNGSGRSKEAKSPVSDYSPPSTSSTESMHKDRYLAKLSNKMENAVDYFAPKRQMKQIISSSYNDSRFGGGGLAQPGMNGGVLSPAYERPGMGVMSSIPNHDEPVRRPHKLESLAPVSVKTKSKKKKKGSQEIL